LPLKDTFIGDDGGRRPIADHITNAKVHFQQSAARNKPNTSVVEQKRLGLFAALPLQVTRFNQATEGSAMKFGEAVVSGLRNYFNFSGRASRSAFWFFLLFCILVPIVGSVGDLFFFSTLAREGLGPIYVISNLALLAPGLAISARRLHDIDRTGWWFLITLTIIGNIWLLVWWCSKGQAGRNRFGPDPLATK
jgi:uncharacterized membrane protein YhaH (DUF805 family)